MQLLGALERSLPRRAPRSPRGFPLIARGGRQQGATGAMADGGHLPLNAIAQILQQMKAVGDLPRSRRALAYALRVEPADHG
jgi:hypothetical protein